MAGAKQGVACPRKPVICPVFEFSGKGKGTEPVGEKIGVWGAGRNFSHWKIRT